MTSKTITPKLGLGKKKEGEIYRLQLFMTESNLQPSDIAKKTSVSERTITHSLYEQKPLGTKLLRELHLNYGVSIDWLISGVGQMYIENYSIQEPSQMYGSDNDRAARVLAFLDDWMTYAPNDEQAWLETQLKFNLDAYRRYLENQNE